MQLLDRFKKAREQKKRPVDDAKRNALRDLTGSEYQRCTFALAAGREIRKDGQLGRRLTKDQQNRYIGFIEGWKARGGGGRK